MKAKNIISVILLALFALLLPATLVISNAAGTLFNQEKLSALLMTNVISDEALPALIKEMTIFEVENSSKEKTLDMRMMTNVLSGVEADEWLDLFAIVLPEEARIALVEDLVGGIFAWFGSVDAYPDIVIPVTGILGGVQENLLPVTAWVFDAFRVPPCSDELAAGFEVGDYGDDPTALITCTPPEEMTNDVVAAASVMLGDMLSAQAPSEDIVLADQISASMSEEAMLAQKKTANTMRRILPLAWALPALCLIIAAGMVIRSPQDAITWLQWPFFATGLIGLILGLRLTNPALMLQNALVPPPAGAPAPAIAVVIKLLESLLGEAGAVVLWVTTPLLLIGAGMLAYTYQENLKQVPAALGAFFKSLVPPTLEEKA